MLLDSWWAVSLKNPQLKMTTITLVRDLCCSHSYLHLTYREKQRGIFWKTFNNSIKYTVKCQVECFCINVVSFSCVVSLKGLYWVQSSIQFSLCMLPLGCIHNDICRRLHTSAEFYLCYIDDRWYTAIPLYQIPQRVWVYCLTNIWIFNLTSLNLSCPGCFSWTTLLKWNLC